MLAFAFDIAPHISTFGWIVIVLGFVCWFFSFLIFVEDVRKGSNRAFILLSSIVLAWGVSYAIFDALLGTPRAEDFARLLYAIGGLLAPGAFYLAYIFAYEHSENLLRNIIIVCVPYLLIVLTLLFPAYSFTLEADKIIFHGGFILYALYMTAVLSAGLIVLIHKYKESAGIFVIELRNLVAMFGLAGLAGFGVSFFLPIITGNFDYFWIGYTTLIILLIGSGLSAIQYNFWSFKVIATEFFISFVGLILLVELFFANSLLDLLLRTAIAVLILFASFFLINSVKREFESRDKIARLLRELDGINVRLKILDKKKSEFLSTASHHLRDPLTSIQGYASMLMEGSFGTVTPQTQEALGKIFESSKRLVTVISDFLDISNIESGDMKYVVEDVDLKAMAKGLVEDMRGAAERAGLVLTFAVKGGDRAKYIVRADSTKIRQVLSNLVDNAIKYTPAGSVSVNLTKDMKTHKMIFSVKDTGIGMSADTLEKIFKKFSRAEGVSKVYTEGTGLGLYVAREIVKKHNGRIWAESEGEKKGSIFNVELDLK